MHWVDARYFPDLVSRLAELDQRLQRLDEDCDRSPDPDALGILDESRTSSAKGFSIASTTWSTARARRKTRTRAERVSGPTRSLR